MERLPVRGSDHPRKTFTGGQPRPPGVVLPAATLSESSASDRHPVAYKAKNIYYLALHKKSLPLPGLHYETHV